MVAFLSQLPSSITMTEAARELTARGLTGTAADAEAFLVQETDRYGLSRAATAIRVRVTVLGPSFLTLTGVSGGDSLPGKRGWADQWVRTTPTTGYVAPFDVLYRVRPDGTALVMATKDVETLEDGSGVVVNWVLSGVPAGTILLLLAPDVIRFIRRRKSA